MMVTLEYFKYCAFNVHPADPADLAMRMTLEKVKTLTN